MPSTALARLTGALVLSLVFIGPIALMIVPEQIVVAGDPVATHASLTASPGLFRLGLTAEAAIVGLEIAITALLWGLLRSTAPTLAATAMLARAVMTTLQGGGLLVGIAVALGAPTLSAELVYAGMTVREATILAWQIPFGLHLLLLAVLVWRSGFLPRVLAPGVVVAGVGYLLHTASVVLLPEFADAAAAGVAIGAMLGELPLFVYLLVRGVRPAPAPAMGLWPANGLGHR